MHAASVVRSCWALAVHDGRLQWRAAHHVGAADAAARGHARAGRGRVAEIAALCPPACPSGGRHPPALPAGSAAPQRRLPASELPAPVRLAVVSATLTPAVRPLPGGSVTASALFLATAPPPVLPKAVKLLVGEVKAAEAALDEAASGLRSSLAGVPVKLPASLVRHLPRSRRAAPRCRRVGRAAASPPSAGLH